MLSGAPDQATTDPTVLLVVESVRVYHRGSASLTELTRTFGVEITVLRGW
jgi:hypothetical protein